MKKVILNLIYWGVVFSIFYFVLKIGIFYAAVGSFTGFLVSIFSPTELIKNNIAKFTRKVLGIKNEKDVY